MKQSSGTPEIIEEFEGIIQSFEDTVTLAGAVKFSQGVLNTVEKKLIKMGGCLMLSSSCSSMGAVISMAQLEYETSKNLIILTSSDRQFLLSSDFVPHVTTYGGVDEFGLCP